LPVAEDRQYQRQPDNRARRRDPDHDQSHHLRLAARIAAQAHGEGERILEEARQQAEEKRAEGVRLAAEQMDEADRYALEMLRKLEQQLEAFTASVRAGIDSLTRKPGDGPPAAWEETREGRG
jgi:regulator of protease activity HflC (stomatin/prohibitin superfamily)